jgi:hypothetical protein
MNYHLKKFRQDYKGAKKERKGKERKFIYHLIGREELDFVFLNLSQTLFTQCPIFKGSFYFFTPFQIFMVSFFFFFFFFLFFFSLKV